MSGEQILYAVEDRIATIAINRPEKKNAINWEMSERIRACLKEAETDRAVHVIVFKGIGDGFSSGYDLGDGMGRAPRQTGNVTTEQEGDGVNVSVWDARARIAAHNEYLMDIWNCWKPVISQVHGYCLGGASGLALACDLLIAGEDARIGYPPVRAIAPGEELAIFAWHVGLKKAKELQLTGDSLTAKEMLRYGCANYVFPNDRLDDETRKIARRIANIDVELLSLSKKAMNRAFEQMGFELSLRSASEFVTLAGRLPSNSEFKRRARDNGMRDALDWRDGPFGGPLGRYPEPED